MMIQHVMVKQLNLVDAFFFFFFFFGLDAIKNELESIMSNHIWNSLSYLLRPNNLVANRCLRRSLNQMI
jgi:hypothetical protein